MKVKSFIGTRGIGKTSQLLEYAVDNDIYYVICANPRHMLEKAHSIGILGRKFIDYTSTNEIQELVVNQTPFVIDNIENYLSTIYPTLRSFTCNIE